MQDLALWASSLSPPTLTEHLLSGSLLWARHEDDDTVHVTGPAPDPQGKLLRRSWGGLRMRRPGGWSGVRSRGGPGPDEGRRTGLGRSPLLSRGREGHLGLLRVRSFAGVLVSFQGGGLHPPCSGTLSSGCPELVFPNLAAEFQRGTGMGCRCPHAIN